MTKDQKIAYGCEVSNWERARKTAGLPYDRATRLAFYARKGITKPKETWNNKDLDVVFGILRAVSDPGNLNAQMHVEESEDERKAAAMDACLAATSDMWQLGDNRLVQTENQRRYIAGTARGILRKEPADCTSAELNKVLGALRRRVGVLRRQNPSAAASLDAMRQKQEAEQPF